MTNCPNCGAPIKGWKCAYCDTEFIDMKQIEQSNLVERAALLMDQYVAMKIYNEALDTMRRFKFENGII